MKYYQSVMIVFINGWILMIL